VRNGGDTVEEYQLSLVGSLSRWSQISPERLRLFPADEGTVTITIKVPRTPEALAGPTPFGVRVVPREHPELSDVAEGTITVTPFGELRAEMNPVTVRGRLSALLRFTVNNRGNAPLEIRLVGKDDEGKLVFDEREPSTQVPAGVVGTPVLRIRPRRRRLTGKPQRYPFAVTVTPPEAAVATGAKPALLRGTYIQQGLVPKWLLFLIPLLLLAGLLAGLLYLPFTNLQSRLFPALNLPSLQLPSVSLPQLPAGGVQATFQQQPPPPVQQQQQQQQGQQQRQQQRGSGTGLGQGTNVLISHSELALTVLGNERGGPPLAVSSPLNPQQQNVNQQNQNQFNQNNQNPNNQNQQNQQQQLQQLRRLQTWTLVRLQDGSTAILPVAADNFVLQQPNSNNNSQLSLQDISGGRQLLKNQVWILRPAGSNDVVTIVNSQTGACMTDMGNGRPVQASTCQNQLAPAQEWQLTAAS
jgi:hypothetical protein